jgi:D-serine deaminase-like pyridoxal phosphate-dependent protein
MKMNKPTLVVDLDRVEANIRQMATKMKKKGLIFRPHFKTHQSHFIARIFRKYGVEKCTVSSVSMAAYFALDGWTDITIAFPANVLETEEMNMLAQKIQLNILVDSAEKVRIMANKISASLAIYIEVEAGYLRSGISIENNTEMDEIIDAIALFSQFTFAGFLSHTGNTYSQSSAEDIVQLFDESRKKLNELKRHFLPKYPVIILSMGDTPAASLAEEFDGIDELRPGNFVFYDVMQFVMGSCSESDIGVAVYCPVVAIYPERNELVIYGGGVHLSKEKMIWKDKVSYGLLAMPTPNGFGIPIKEAFVSGLSQEHGIVSMSAYELEKIKLGDILAVFPVHSCMTVDLNSQLVSLQGHRIEKFRTF